ncbi:hypothetical protein GW17_00028463 [Ensete ventricosum]|nr:hypothetical protein GW17_00028463 [Ensete ventricosum]
MRHRRQPASTMGVAASVLTGVLIPSSASDDDDDAAVVKHELPGEASSATPILLDAAPLTGNSDRFSFRSRVWLLRLSRLILAIAHLSSQAGGNARLEERRKPCNTRLQSRNVV